MTLNPDAVQSCTCQGLSGVIADADGRTMAAAAAASRSVRSRRAIGPSRAALLLAAAVWNMSPFAGSNALHSRSHTFQYANVQVAD